MELKDGETLLFIGDSITDCGRARPVGMGTELGNGYVKMADSLMAAGYPEQRIRVLNTGISGNRICDLERRWQSDVLELSPSWLSIKIGINDVWRQFDSPLSPDQVSIERYEETFRRLLEMTYRELSLEGLVIISPYFLETNREEPMRMLMDDYGKVAARIAAEFNAIFVDTQAVFDNYLRHRPTQSLCGDRVHPNGHGHMLIAGAFLSAVGFDWSKLSDTFL